MLCALPDIFFFQCLLNILNGQEAGGEQLKRALWINVVLTERFSATRVSFSSSLKTTSSIFFTFVFVALCPQTYKRPVSK